MQKNNTNLGSKNLLVLGGFLPMATGYSSHIIALLWCNIDSDWVNLDPVIYMYMLFRILSLFVNFPQL